MSSQQPNQSLIDGIRCLQYLVSSDRAYPDVASLPEADGY